MDAPAQLHQSLEAQLAVRAEQARLQDAMIEMLNNELRECRQRLVHQANEITEFQRVLMIRHDLLMSRYTASLAAPSAGPDPSRVRRVLRRIRSAVRLLVR
jgi:hypothetical protein